MQLPFAALLATSLLLTNLPQECQALGRLLDGSAARARALAASRRAGGHAAASEERRGAGAAPKPAGFFGEFVEGESTYDEGALGVAYRDVDPSASVSDGWSPDTGAGGARATPGLDAAKFHESPSAAYKQAWQTHYPAPTSGIARRAGSPSVWYQSGGNSWNEAYNSFAGSQNSQAAIWKRALNMLKPGGADSGEKPAAWFDSSVGQYDGWGRPMEPSSSSGKRYPFWSERSVNTTLECQDKGCTAETNLQAFDGTKERAMKCKLNIGVHPTDFEDTYGGEYVANLTVNGVVVSAACHPGASGCETGSGESLFPCIADLDLSSIVDWTGTLKISASIPPSVDECPYNGNYLSAVPVVTCLVAPQDPSPLKEGPVQDADALSPEYADFAKQAAMSSGTSGAVGAVDGGSYDVGRRIAGNGNAPMQPIGNTDGSPMDSNWDMSNQNVAEMGTEDTEGQATMMTGSNTFRALAPIACAERGCRAKVQIKINSTEADLESCKLTVVMNQTDFDASDESVEFVGVDGRNLSSFSPPSRNPCKERAQGQTDVGSPMLLLVDGEDISDEAADGYIEVSAKISDLVDECPSNGYLFHGLAQVDCVVSSPSQVSAGPASLFATAGASAGGRGAAAEAYGTPGQALMSSAQVPSGIAPTLTAAVARAARLRYRGQPSDV
eukprot:TRINITY_DN1954_c0_g2_i1.p1 TRINITY_DN1954_c0_g2~~TRINITY_DN1954_c0_g2_i1.p1  ORF type:complete len:670 (-),score=173.40 TRINITY_DN1954_c0_g2_i1:407-2416(-)